MSAKLDAEIGKALGLDSQLNDTDLWPEYSGNLIAAEIIVDAMGERGFWLKLTSPFAPTDTFRSVTDPESWEKTRYYWGASFDFHGTTDSRPLWFARAKNPAEAICMAAKKCIEENPDVQWIGLFASQEARR